MKINNKTISIIILICLFSVIINIDVSKFSTWLLLILTFLIINKIMVEK